MIFPDAPCQSTDPDLFYPEKGMNNHVKLAKAICNGCEFRDACLQLALRVPPVDDHGIWGGTTVDERRRIRWPRKTAVAA